MMRIRGIFSSFTWRGSWLAGLALTLLLGSGSLVACGGESNDRAGNRGNTGEVDTLAVEATSPGGSGSTGDSKAATPPQPDPPWGYPALAASQVPSVYLAEWRKAANRATCALIAPASLGAGQNAAPRAATFAGGWAVAYDFPEQRSAFGVAGAGASTEGDTYSEWTNRRDWPDGSFAEYGPEGGQGLNQLAYLRVAGQDCLYNVWSRLGLDHLELLLDQLRRVTVPPA